MQWVSAKLQFGLGNRLFQLAAAYKASRLWNLPLVFAMPFCRPSDHGDFQTIFRLFPTIERIWNAEPSAFLDQSGVFQETRFPPTPPGNRTLLRGMWQAASFVLDSFEPTWTENPSLLQKYNLSSEQPTVFLHVRLGDYKFLPHHQVPLLTYFAECMSRFPETTRFLIFSDSIEEVVYMPLFSERCTFVYETNEYDALYLMSRCTGAIISNSTFSWWGAFFARQYAKRQIPIYMPDTWLTVHTESTDTIYPHFATVVSVK
jgi:hypothetical protein